MSTKYTAKGKQNEKVIKGVWETTKLFSRRAVAFFLAFLVVVIVLAIFSSGATSARSSAADVVDQIRSGECATVFSGTTAEFRENTNEGAWMTYCEQVGTVLTGNVDIMSTDINTNAEGTRSGTVRFEILGNDGATYDVFVDMLDVDGWKLNTFAFQVVEPMQEDDS